MKKLVFSVMFTLLVGFVLPAATPVPGTVLKKLPLALKTPTGMVWDGRRLWVADLDTATLNAVDPATGKITETIDAPGYAPEGLAWDGKLLWVLDKADKTVYALDPVSKETVRALPLDTQSAEGLAWDGTTLWTDDARAGVINRLDSSDGTTFKSFPSPLAGGPRGEEIGMTFDGRNLYVADRISNTIYRVDAGKGVVLDSFDSPGPYPAGLAWDGKHLWNVDYETRTIYELSAKREAPYVRSAPKHEKLVYREAWRNFGPGVLKTLDIYVAVPHDLPNQKMLKAPTFKPKPAGFVTDQWGQKCAHFHFENLEPQQVASAQMTVDAELYKVRWYIDPNKAGTLADIPADIREAYTKDNSKLDFTDPIIQKAVKAAVGKEKNPYWIARRINRYIQDHMHYEMVGGWNIAPTVLARGSGSCSEYTFVMLAMCHAAGLPARYDGSVVIRGDDASRDDDFHRWVEIYLPNYGWVPVDPSGGDSKVPATRARYFGGLNNRFIITTQGAGGSKTLGWDYNSDAKWTAKGRVRLMQEKDGDWVPIGKVYEARESGTPGGLTCKPGKE